MTTDYDYESTVEVGEMFVHLGYDLEGEALVLEVGTEAARILYEDAGEFAYAPRLADLHAPAVQRVVVDEGLVQVVSGDHVCVSVERCSRTFRITMRHGRITGVWPCSNYEHMVVRVAAPPTTWAALRAALDEMD